MPEGHVIHRIAAALTSLLRGQVVHASSPQGRFSRGAALLDGCRFTGAIAHGKHLFASFDPGARAPHVLHVHLGLYGFWSLAELKAHPPAPRGAVRLRLVGAQAVADLNGPSRCEVLTAAEVDALRAGLGPDPLLGDSEPAAFVEAVRSSRRAIGVLLMDQGIISGVGNIYRAELLFRHRIHPATPGQRLSVRKLRQLWSDAVVLLADGKRSGAIVTTDAGPLAKPPTGWTKPAERAPDEEADLRWYAYRRSGRPCHRCGSLIAASTLAGRTVYWCPRCQRAPAR